LLVGTNPDLTIPTPVGPAPGAGTIIKGIEVSSEVSPLIIGKPYAPLYSLALKRSKSMPEKTLMIGDRLETDIRGAQRLGMMTALVLTGIATREQAEVWDPPPDIVAEDALQVIEMLRNHDD
jgi:4-nitrophenyl phosphatase